MITSLSYSFSQPIQGSNWMHPAYDARNSGFSPQSVINKDNLNSLELKWIFQVPGFFGTVPGAGDFGFEIPHVPTGIQTVPLVVNGIVYIANDFNGLFAIRAESNDLLWRFSPPIATFGEKPWWNRVFAQHGIDYYDGKVWMQASDCTIYGLDPINGDKLVEIPETCSNIPGNTGVYFGSFAPIFYNDLLITRPSGGAGSTGERGFIAAYDINTEELVWRWFVVPPTGGDPNWDFAEASKGNIEPFVGDWGNNDLIGGGSVFSLIAVDEETGIIYFPTGAPALSYDASLRPGPNLFSSSIVALDAETGELVWYHQTTPHDINGHEPTRSLILADAEVGGEERRIVMTASRADYAYILDASNGELLHEPISIGAQKINVFNTNRGSQADLTLSQNRLVDDIYCPGQIGGSSSVSAFAYNTFFIASQNFCSTLSEARIFYKDQLINGYVASPAPVVQNSMISAIDVSTGNLKWRFTLDNRYQGGISVSGGVVYLVDLDGDFYALDADTGEVLRMIPMNGAGNTAVTIAGDAQGKMTLYVATGGRKSGIIAAFGLPESSSTEQNNTLLIIGGVVLAVIVLSAYAVVLRAYNRKRR